MDNIHCLVVLAGEKDGAPRESTAREQIDDHLRLARSRRPGDNSERSAQPCLCSALLAAVERNYLKKLRRLWASSACARPCRRADAGHNPGSGRAKSPEQARVLGHRL